MLNLFLQVVVSDNDYLFLNKDLGFISFCHPKTKKIVENRFTEKSKTLGVNSEKQVQ